MISWTALNVSHTGNITNPLPTSTPTLEPSTFAWEETNAKLTRRLVYYLLHGLVGLITSLFNGLVILVYFRKPKIRKHISLVMLNMFVFCFLHGLIVGIVYPMQRIYRYAMHPDVCVVTTLLMDLADKYIVLLLPVLAVERFLLVKCSFIGSTKTRIWAVCSLVGLFVLALLFSWLPLVPQLGVPEGKHWQSNNTDRQKYLIRFYKHYTCHGKLNKKNVLDPLVTLLVAIFCVLVVVIVYVWMCLIARSRLNAFARMTAKKRKRLTKAVISVMFVVLTFITTMLPYGIVVQIAAFCDADTSLRQHSYCNGITLELRFVCSIFAHLGNLLAPMLFAFLNPYIRRTINLYVRDKVELCVIPKAAERQPLPMSHCLSHHSSSTERPPTRPPIERTRPRDARNNCQGLELSFSASYSSNTIPLSGCMKNCKSADNALELKADSEGKVRSRQHHIRFNLDND